MLPPSMLVTLASPFPSSVITLMRAPMKAVQPQNHAPATRNWAANQPSFLFLVQEDRVTPATSLERRRSLLIDSSRPRPVQARERVGVITTDCLPHTTYVEILRAHRQRIPGTGTT